MQSSFFKLDDQLPPAPPSNSQDENQFGKNGDGLNSKNRFSWEALLTGYGCGMVFGVAMLYITFRKGEPNWFITVVDAIHQWRAKRLLRRNTPSKR